MKNRQLIYNILEKINPSTEIRNKAIEDQQLENRVKRLQTLNLLENAPTSVLDSDEAVDKFIAQQGLLEPN